MNKLRKHPGPYIILAWLTGCAAIYEKHHGPQWVHGILTWTTGVAVVVAVILLVAQADSKETKDYD